MSATKVSQFASTGGTGENQDVQEAVGKYERFHQGGWNESKKLSYMDMVNKYYDLATSFYEFGWGESFHFAHRLKGESLRESLKRHEHYLAACGGFQKDDKVRICVLKRSSARLCARRSSRSNASWEDGRVEARSLRCSRNASQLEACELPSEVRVTLRAIIAALSLACDPRKGLHLQSQSGPCAQRPRHTWHCHWQLPKLTPPC